MSSSDAAQAPEPGRPPGRPRSAEADAAILGATRDLLLEEGYRALSMESVRIRAGVGKATVYRRWKTKQDLVAAAVEQLAGDLQAPDDTGSFKGDLAALMELASKELYSPRIATFIPRLMAEAIHEETLFDVFHDRLVAPRRRVTRELVQRGIDRGELRADLDLDTAVDVLVGPIVYRIIISGGRLERLGRDPLGAFSMVLEGLRAR